VKHSILDTGHFGVVRGSQRNNLVDAQIAELVFLPFSDLLDAVAVLDVL
jgi:hypothetical protein